ncbi:MAG: hypothetical protein LBR16_09040 [Treponema sp.]|jgi:hypothetical protein|nr:hypothetical protein [Treponema sp.]
MGEKEKAIYAPGELARVRNKLGVSDPDEARRMAALLGGEVGRERDSDEERARTRARRDDGDASGRRDSDAAAASGRRSAGTGAADSGRGARKRRLQTLDPKRGEDEEEAARDARKEKLPPEDDPELPVRAGYLERFRMDRFAAQSEFDIKTAGQVLAAFFNFAGKAADYVSPAFVKRRMNDYYRQIETLVVSTRSLLPRNNLKRGEQLRKTSPFAYQILDTIRCENIEKISNDLAKIQGHPRQARVEDFADILRAIYRPLFILERLDFDSHIRGAYKILYKKLYLEHPLDAEEKYQNLIRMALAAFREVRRGLHYSLYPLLMKLLSDRWLPYETFFEERKNRFLAFIGAGAGDQIVPGVVTAAEERAEAEAGADTGEAQSAERGEAPGGAQDAAQPSGAAGAAAGSDAASPKGNAPRAPRSSAPAPKAASAPRPDSEADDAELAAEKRAVNKGLETLETLFPRAGWQNSASFPDFYPYFADMFSLGEKGAVLIAPSDPLQQVMVLMRVLEELFFALRYVSFGTVIKPDGAPERLDESLEPLMNDWRYHYEQGFEKEYLPRLNEYVRLLEGSSEERNSRYCKKILTEMHALKRLIFLPFYKFEMLVPVSIQKKDVYPVYPKVRQLRRGLTAAAAGIEKGLKEGGAARRAVCEGVQNPWAPYEFQVPNPVSRRLNALLSPQNRTNASLIFCALAVTAVLDFLVNNEHSWAYTSPPGAPFRSKNNEGIFPQAGVDGRIDADAIFRQTMKKR